MVTPVEDMRIFLHNRDEYTINGAKNKILGNIKLSQLRHDMTMLHEGQVSLEGDLKGKRREYNQCMQYYFRF